MARRLALAAVAALAVAASSTTGRETTTIIGKVRMTDGSQAVLRITEDGQRREASLQAADRHVVRSLTLFMSLGELQLLRRYIDDTIAELEKPATPAR